MRNQTEREWFALITKKEAIMPNMTMLKELLDKFASEASDALIATAIVSNDGTAEVYKIQEGHDYNVKRSAAILAVIQNVLNNTLCELYDGIENVTEMLATTKKGYFLYREIGNGEYFHGVTFKSESDVASMRQLMEKYAALFADALK
jgi:hypothetical protein